MNPILHFSWPKKWHLQPDELSHSWEFTCSLEQTPKQCVASWNAITGSGGSVEVELKTPDSPYFSYGIWAANPKLRSSGQDFTSKDGSVQFEVDTLILKKPIPYLQLRVTLRRTSLEAVAPKLKAIDLALETEEYASTSISLPSIDLSVPLRRQMEYPQQGNRWCGPTSVSMIMEYFHTRVATSETAALACDPQRDIYGNWAFNLAAAAEHGFKAHGAFLSAPEMARALQMGFPLIGSIRKTPEPIIDNLPQGGYSSGHLLVIRGITETPRGTAVVVNDPWGEDIDHVRREYLLEQFDRRWRHFVYFIYPETMELPWLKNF